MLQRLVPHPGERAIAVDHNPESMNDVAIAADGEQPQDCHGRGAGELHDGGKCASPRDRRQATIDRPGTRECPCQNDADRHWPAEEAVQGKATRIQHRSHEDDHVCDDRHKGEGLTDRRAITPCQEFRDGYYLRSQQKRYEDVDHEEERKDIEPLIEGGRYAHEIGRPNHPDELLGADVRRNEASTDHVPSKFAASQKIIRRGGAFTPPGQKANQRQRCDEEKELDIVEHAERKLADC